MTPRIVAVGDAHFPWANPRCLEWVYDQIKKLQPDIVVQIGDLYDFYNQSNFARSLNLITPANEIKKGRAQAEEFWQKVQSFAPKAKCIQLLGNHEGRLLKQVLRRAPEFESLINFKSVFEFPGVETQKAENEEIILDGPVVLMHGWMSKHGEHAKKNLKSTIHGHLHMGAVTFFRHGKRIIWELDCGTVANLKAKVFDYRSQLKLSNWTNGLGVVDENGP